MLSSYPQLKRSFYIWLFQMPLAEMIVGADDLAFIDGLWGDWTGSAYDASEDLAHVKDCLRGPENLSAAIGYYRDTFGGAETAPEHAILELLSGHETAPSLADSPASRRRTVGRPAQLGWHNDCNNGWLSCQICYPGFADIWSGICG